MLLVLLGFSVGVCGGIANAALLCTETFRGFSTPMQAGSVWAAAMLMLLWIGAGLSWLEADLRTVAASVAVPVLGASFAVTLLLGRENEA